MHVITSQSAQVNQGIGPPTCKPSFWYKVLICFLVAFVLVLFFVPKLLLMGVVQGRPGLVSRLKREGDFNSLFQHVEIVLSRGLEFSGGC